jgi:hypothetical protein
MSSAVHKNAVWMTQLELKHIDPEVVATVANSYAKHLVTEEQIAWAERLADEGESRW